MNPLDPKIIAAIRKASEERASLDELRVEDELRSHVAEPSEVVDPFTRRLHAASPNLLDFARERATDIGFTLMLTPHVNHGLHESGAPCLACGLEAERQHIERVLAYVDGFTDE